MIDEDRVGATGIAAVVSLLTTRMGVAGWMLAIGAATATNLADFLAAPAPGMAPSASFAAVGVLRVAVVFLAAYILTRKLSGCGSPLAITRGFWPFAGLSVLLLLPTAFAVRASLALIGSSATPMARAAAITLLTLALTVLLLRVSAWKTALAVGDRAGLRQIWSGLRGATMPLATALVALAAVPQLLHSWLTLIAVQADAGDRVWLSIADGLISGVLLAILVAVGVAAWERSCLRIIASQSSDTAAAG